MFCKICGKELPEGAKFCSGCGNPVTPAAPVPDPAPVPAAEPAGAVSPVPGEGPACEAASVSGETPAPGVAPVSGEIPVSEMEGESAAASVEQTPPTPGAPSAPKGRGKMGVVLLGVGAVVLIAVAVLLIRFLPGVMGGGKGAYAYLNDDGELMFLSDLKEKTQPLLLTDEAGDYPIVQFSPDGKRVYFTNGDGALYTVTAAGVKKGEQAERIARDVGGFRVLKDGKIVYIQWTDDTNRVSVYEKGESYRLLRNYARLMFSEDEKSIYYVVQDDSDDTYALYKVAIAKDAEAERLLKGAGSIYTALDSDVLVYSVDNGAGSNEGYPADTGTASARNDLTLYSVLPGGERTKLAGDVNAVAGVSVEKGEVNVYYYVQEVESRTLYDFVTDREADGDAAILAGAEPASPDYYNGYYPKEVYLENGSVLYNDNSDGKHQLDVSSLLEPGMSVEELNYYDVWDLATREAQRLYDLDREAYDAQSQLRRDARTREDLRSALKEGFYNETTYTLYHYSDGKSEAIATGLGSNSNDGDGDHGIFFYQKAERAEGKVGDVADFSETYEIRQKLNEQKESGPWYQNVDDRESELDLEADGWVRETYVLDESEVVLLVREEGEDSLRSYRREAQGLTHSDTILEDEEFRVSLVDSEGHALYLFTDLEEDSSGSTMGECKLYRDGKLETIAREVYEVLIVNGGKTVYVLPDKDTRSETVELAVLKDGKQTRISDEVDYGKNPAILDETRILYISDSDLCLWDGKSSRIVARDVEAVWASSRVEDVKDLEP